MNHLFRRLVPIVFAGAFYASSSSAYVGKNNDGLVSFRQGDYEGLKNSNTGRVLLEPVYGSIDRHDDGYFVVRNNKWKHGLLRFVKGRLRWLIKPKYGRITWVRPGTPEQKKNKDFFLIVHLEERRGLLDRHLKPILETQYTILEGDGDFVRFGVNGKEGGLVPGTTMKIPMKYDSIRTPYFLGGLVTAYRNHAYTLFAPSLAVLEEGLSDIHPMPIASKNGARRKTYLEKNKSSSGVYDQRSMSWDIPLVNFRITSSFLDENGDLISIIEKSNRFGILRNSDVVVAPQYGSLEFFESSSARAIAGLQGQYGLIGPRGEPILPLNCDTLSYRNQGLFACRKNDTFTLRTQGGTELASRRFERIGNFFENMATAELDGKNIIINQLGVAMYPMVTTEKSEGFETSEALHLAFIDAVQAKSDELLRAFSRKISVNEHSEESLHHANIVYRKFPHQRTIRPYSFQKISNRMFQRLLRFKKLLHQTGKVSQLRLGEYEKPWAASGIAILQGKRVGFSESFRLLPMGDETYHIKFGEMMHLDGHWKSFTPVQFGRVSQ